MRSKMRKKRKKAFVITKVKPKIIFVPSQKFWGKKIIGVIFLVLGSVILTSSLFYFFLIPYLFVPRECQTVPLNVIHQSPQKIYFPSLNLELPVIEGKVIEDQWLLPDEAVAFLPGVSIFEEEGNLVIFGRNNPKVLGRLSTIKKKEKIYLFSESNYLVFEVEETKRVLPTDESIFFKTSGKTLTIFSTADYLNGKRFLVKAQRIP